MTEHKNVFCALAAAQMEMGVLVKDAKNPHFNSKYADLAGVVSAALPALTKHGIGLHSYSKRDEYGRYWTTALVHGATETKIECDVELILGKNDMQGYKSAVTYAKRIGLESVTGLAPEDDDGNAAAKNAPKGAVSPRPTPVQSTANGTTHGAIVEPPHNPETGEVRDERNPPQPEPEEEEADPPSVTAFIDQVKEQLAMRGEKATREALEHGYGMAVIENIGKRKPSARAKPWFEIFTSLHDAAIQRIQDQDLRRQVRSAIALKQAQINGENPDPAEFGHPFGDPSKRMPSFVGEGG